MSSNLIFLFLGILIGIALVTAPFAITALTMPMIETGPKSKPEWKEESGD